MRYMFKPFYSNKERVLIKSVLMLAFCDKTWPRFDAVDGVVSGPQSLGQACVASELRERSHFMDTHLLPGINVRWQIVIARAERRLQQCLTLAAPPRGRTDRYAWNRRRRCR